MRSGTESKQTTATPSMRMNLYSQTPQSILNLQYGFRMKIRGVAARTVSVLFFGTPQTSWKQAQALEALTGRDLSKFDHQHEVEEFWEGTAVSDMICACCVPTQECTKACGYEPEPVCLF